MMLQDIAPRVYHNEYRPRAPHAGDRVFFYAPGVTLYNAATDEPFTYEEAKAMADFEDSDLTYLFAIDEIGFYRCPYTPEAIAAASCSKKDPDFRIQQPGWLSFAAITAHQLHGWYNKMKFCGRCGKPMRPHAVDRAMECPECKNLIYPIICPCVIVAVTHGDRILLTRYSPKHRPGVTRNYALIAGFTEIGETIEDTVRREVMEEVGLKVKNLRFYKSQPWSFGGSLLFGFYCDLDGDDETITLEEDELSEGVWFSRDELPEGGGPISLTHEMIDRFREGPV